MSFLRDVVVARASEGGVFCFWVPPHHRSGRKGLSGGILRSAFIEGWIRTRSQRGTLAFLSFFPQLSSLRERFLLCEIYLFLRGRAVVAFLSTRCLLRRWKTGVSAISTAAVLGDGGTLGAVRAESVSPVGDTARLSGSVLPPFELPQPRLLPFPPYPSFRPPALP